MQYEYATIEQFPKEKTWAVWRYAKHIPVIQINTFQESQ